MGNLSSWLSESPARSSEYSRQTYHSSEAAVKVSYHATSNCMQHASESTAKAADSVSRNLLTASEVSIAAVKRAFNSNNRNDDGPENINAEGAELYEDARVAYEKHIKEQTDRWVFGERNADDNVLRDQYCDFVANKVRKVLPKKETETEQAYLQRVTSQTIAHSYAPAFQSAFFSKKIPGEAEMLIEMEQMTNDARIFGELGVLNQQIANQNVSIETFFAQFFNKIWKQQLPVRLIVTRLNHSFSFFGRISNTVATSVNRVAGWGKYGYVHTALMIGSVVVDWNGSSLVTPYYNLPEILASIDMNDVCRKEANILKRTLSTMQEFAKQLLSFLTFGILIGKINESKVRTVAEFCTAWNREKTYNVTDTNCQHFVDGLLKHLGFEPKMLQTTAYGPFLENIRQGNFQMECELGGTKYTFQSHSQVDGLLHSFSQNKSQWDRINSDSKFLLKAFHETFVDRYLTHLRNPRGKHFAEGDSFLKDLPSITCKCFKLDVSIDKDNPMEISPLQSMEEWLRPVGIEPLFALPPESVLEMNRRLARHRMQNRVVNKHGIRILALDGGGVRGLVQSLCLSHLQQRGLESIIGSFDLICGTSVGGLLALYIVYGAGRFQNVDEQKDSEHPDQAIPHVPDAPLILEMAKNLPAKVFAQKSLYKMMADSMTKGRMVCSSKLEEELSVAFQGAVMSETSHPKCFVVANRLQGTSNCKCIFRNYSLPVADQEREEATDDLFSSDFISVAAAARMTSSAPIVFPPVEHDKDFFYQDGGIRENCPVYEAMRQARVIWPNRPVEAIVSLGTGRLSPTMTQQQQPGMNQYFSFVKQIIDLSTNSHHKWTDFERDQRDHIPQLCRLDVELQREIQLFESDPATISELQSLTEAMLADRHTDIDELVAFLNSD